MIITCSTHGARQQWCIVCTHVEKGAVPAVARPPLRGNPGEVICQQCKDAQDKRGVDAITQYLFSVCLACCVARKWVTV